MEYLTQFIDIVLHLDKHLAVMVQQYGLWIYGILFVIIFSETGFVVTPFLPGGSLLFVAGALAAIGGGGMDVYLWTDAVTVAAPLASLCQDLVCNGAVCDKRRCATARTADSRLSQHP